MASETALVFLADHPAFAGHFPGAPIVPGVLLLDAALHALQQQTGCAVTQIASAKFLQPVTPGEVLALSCEGGDAGRHRFEITSADRRAATGQLVTGPAG